MTKQADTNKAVRDLAGRFEKGFGVKLETKTEKGVVTFNEVPPEGKVHGSTGSSRRNWLARRAREAGFVQQSPTSFRFEGAPEEETPEANN